MSCGNHAGDHPSRRAYFARQAHLDTESSASRQHYIDTGRYLEDGEAIEAGEGGDIELGFDEDTATCPRCGDTGAEAYTFGRQGRRLDGTWGVVETYIQLLCSDCAIRAGRL